MNNINNLKEGVSAAVPATLFPLDPPLKNVIYLVVFHDSRFQDLIHCISICLPSAITFVITFEP